MVNRTFTTGLCCALLFLSHLLSAQTAVFNVYLSPRNVVPPVRHGLGLGDIRLAYDSANCMIALFNGNITAVKGDTIQNIILYTLRPGEHPGAQGLPASISLPFILPDPSEPHKAFVGGQSVNFSTNPKATELKAAFSNDALSVIVYTDSDTSITGSLRGALARDFGVSGLSSSTANLYGANISPPIISDGTGSVEAFTAFNTLLLTGSVSMDNAANRFSMATLRIGKPGETGIPIDTMVAKVDTVADAITFDLKDNGKDLTFPQLDQFFTGKMNITIHTQEHPEGELKDQLFLATSAYYADLTGMHTVPEGCTDAVGRVAFYVERDSILNVVGCLEGLDADFLAAELRCGKMGQTGPKVMDLTFGPAPGSNRKGSFDPFFNRFPMDSLTQAKLRRGELYVLIRTAGNVANIRGQLLPESQVNLEGFFSGDQVVPASSSQARGQVSLAVGDTVAYLNGSVNNLDADAGDTVAVEIGFEGVGLGANSGGALSPISLNAAIVNADGSIEFQDERIILDPATLQAAKLRRANIRISGDTVFRPTRANLGPVSTEVYYTSLTGNRGLESQDTEGRGGVQLWKNQDQISFGGSFINPLDTTLENVIFYSEGGFGDRLNIRFPLKLQYNFQTQVGLIGSDTNYQVVDTMSQQLRSGLGGLILSDDTTASEDLGGNFTKITNRAFYARLKGSNVVAPNSSSGQGKMQFTLDGNKLTYTGTFQGLTGVTAPDKSKIHLGSTGINGPELFELKPYFPIIANRRQGKFGDLMGLVENFISLSDQQVKDLQEGRLYVSIESDSFPEGEIRGQILPLANRMPEIGPILMEPNMPVSLDAGTQMGFDLVWTGGMDGDKQALSSILEIGLDSALSQPIIQVNTGDQLMYSLSPSDITALDAALQTAQVSTGDTATLFVRLSTTDGSECRSEQPFPIQVIRNTSVGLEPNLGSSYKLALYPTPANREIRVSLEGSGPVLGHLSLYELQGRKLIHQAFSWQPGTADLTMDVSRLPIGLYTLVLETEAGRVAVKKVLIQR